MGAVVAACGNQTLRMLEELDIPYDEIHFGQPYAHVYVDASVACSALDTEKGYDFVSLYDGDSAEAPRLAHLSGRSVPPGAFGVRGGEMLLVFESDSSIAADGLSRWQPEALSLIEPVRLSVEKRECPAHALRRSAQDPEALLELTRLF